MSVAKEKTWSSYSIFNSKLLFCSFLFKFDRSQNGRLFTPIFEMCGGFGPTMNIWYKGQMALGESWWILALADGDAIGQWQGFPMPTGCHLTQKLSDQPGEWRPGPLVCHLWKCESAFFFCFFFLKFFHMVQWCPMYAWRLVKRETMCDPTVLFS